MRIDGAVLSRWRSLDAATAVAVIADHAKQDRTFKPVKDATTSRWHVTVNGNEFELLLTGPKFWDTRARAGGGGAIDLTMHLGGTDFKGAVRRLQTLRL
jgi:hypothetical protein